jgi:glycosyltransferase involved in cell wall biosynthesis
LAREQFGLRESAATVLAPATGGLDLEALPRPASPEQNSDGRVGPPRLLSVRGYENAYVRIRVLIRAFEQFLRLYPDAHLFIDVSKSNQDAERDAVMERWIRRSTARDHITLLHLGRTELFESMQGCHLYVSATRCDGVSISLLEAIYLGMVPVVSRHEATASLLEQVQGAVQVGRLQAAEFARGFAEAYEFARTSKSFADHNRQVICDRFSREKNILRIEGLYHELAARKQGSEDRLPQLLNR